MQHAHRRLTPAQHIAAAAAATTATAGALLLMQGRRQDGLCMLGLAGIAALGCLVSAEVDELRRRVRSVQIGNGHMHAQARQINEELRRTRSSVEEIARALRALAPPPATVNGRRLGVIRNN